MVSTFSPNIQLEEPARGDQVGTWDTPVNSNMNVLDLVSGGTASISLNNSPVVLAAAQFQCKTLVFNSTLTGSVIITFPSTFTKSYEVFNQCTGSSAFTITLKTTLATPGFVCPPPGVICEVANIGGNIYFKNLERIGTYWDYAGSSVPNWVSGSTPAPYLNCDGTAFSSATFPNLTTVLGGTTLPDSRGRTRATLNQGTGRMTAANGGVDGNTKLSGGGLDSVTLSAAQIPSHTHSYTDPGHTHTVPMLGNAGIASNPAAGSAGSAGNAVVVSASVGITINNTGGDGLHTNTQPTYIAGLTLIRAG